jgi:hypothetical protein
MKTIFLLDDTTVNQSSTKSQQALKAISDTLQILFGSSSKQSPTKAKKRTILKRPGAQIMTEEHVIIQMEEANNKKNTNDHVLVVNNGMQQNVVKKMVR